MENWTDRTELLLGKDKMQRLRNAHILVVGVGGVGAYAAEMLCRAGVGEMTLIDADNVQPTNINRQLPATHATVGRSKTEVLAERFRDINPKIKLIFININFNFKTFSHKAAFFQKSILKFYINIHFLSIVKTYKKT